MQRWPLQEKIMDPIANIEGEFIRRFKTDLGVTQDVLALIQYLEASQYDLIQMAVHDNVWIGPVPPNPGGEGSIEFGLVPYWIANPPAFVQDYINQYPVLKDIWWLLTVLVPNQISDV